MSGFKVTISGTVQGVGFRPFVYRTAKRNNIGGYIKNSGNSVELSINGDKKNIDKFLYELKNNKPPLSRINSIDIKPCNEQYSDFRIVKSEKQGASDSVIPPDVAICDTCLGEIFNRENLRYLYPFTVCTDCGPRFTIIQSLPYDRENTTMSAFKMCEECGREYLDPDDRRFRAEPVCCPDCGPVYELYKGQENTRSDNPIRDAAAALDNGNIVAVKGIGGTHLCTSTTDANAILQMRKLLGRPSKPFAIMARDMSVARKLVYVTERDERLMLSRERPIVILPKKSELSGNISPGLDTIGIMLPYTGMHHLLFHYSKEPAFVMTSANLPGEPMALYNKDILSLGAGFSLLHNRDIKNRCDDSVIRAGRNCTFVRRSRGFVPSPVEVAETGATVLSLGAELDVTACLLKNNRAFLTQFIGNTTKPGTLAYLESAVTNLMELTGTDGVDAIAVDMHPSFNTSVLGQELSEKFSVPLIKCQHHFAHAASLSVESGIDRMVCITADGVGYGNDGTIWGGEIIAVDDGFERAGNLKPQLIPGGDLAARYPARVVAGILSGKYNSDELSGILEPYFGQDELRILLRQVETGFNSPFTSSTGRVLDAVSALLGVCTERTYEGEPAMKLEAFAKKGKVCVDIPVLVNTENRRYVLDTTAIVDAVYMAKEHGLPLHDIAASAQDAVAVGLCGMAIKAATDRGIDIIGFSGGVAYNDAIVTKVRDIATLAGFEFIIHKKVPCGDGGISIGQAIMAVRGI
ncbi:MAG: carbamoyltransferase HypF [Candidatus Methanoperedens sp.]|jgi:hydrogenase maturation protein HypF|nr:carbamoyltransferase HypF [Candidatus Methanoperedens sp.]PKL54656.1 MAG: carbamoyltransferase HypF [Candidatus Methanoperedenaceae archaeon HGW-Methanoperedenaceae-1]